MVALLGEDGEGQAPPPEGSANMPKLILIAATLLLGRSPAPMAADGRTAEQAAVHSMTRSRVATRRLRAPGARAPHVDLGPLALTRRH